MVREPDERQQPGKDACSSAQLDRAVARNVPVEAYTRREKRFALGPLAQVDGLPVLERNFAQWSLYTVNRRGSRPLEFRVEDRNFEAQTRGQAQFRIDPPFVLDVNTGQPEGEFRARILIAGVSELVGECGRFRVVDEVVHRIVGVVSGSLAHVTVAEMLVFVRQSGGERVLSQTDGHIVGDVEGIVQYAVVEREDFCAERHVTFIGFTVAAQTHDVDEREKVSVRFTGVVDVRERSEQLVRDLRAEDAVQLGRDRTHAVFLLVTGIGERDGVDAVSACVVQPDAARGGSSAHEVVVLGFDIVVAHHQLVVLADVPVDAGHDFVVVRSRVAEILVCAGIVIVLLFEEIRNPFQVGDGGL